MGDGSTSSYRWQDDRKLTLQEQINYWRDQTIQLRSELDQRNKTVERLTRKLERAEQLLTRYANTFGFHTPTNNKDPKTTQENPLLDPEPGQE